MNEAIISYTKMQFQVLWFYTYLFWVFICNHNFYSKVETEHINGLLIVISKKK